MNISILDMGKTKKRNVRESILSILGREYPLSVRKIYATVKKEYKLDVTYQAVFKLVKEMLADGILENGENKMEYKLNMNWIMQLENELKMISQNYKVNKNESSSETAEDINKFVSSVGPKVKDYLGLDKCSVISISSGGKIYAIGLWKYLLREGVDCKFEEYRILDDKDQKGISIDKSKVNGRKIILIDSEIYSGRHYYAALDKFSKYKDKYKIKDFKFATNKDFLNVADFCRIKG